MLLNEFLKWHRKIEELPKELGRVQRVVNVSATHARDCNWRIEPATIFLQLRYTLQLSNLRPIQSPSGPLPQTALDLDVGKALALIEPRIFSPPKLICNRFYDFPIVHAQEAPSSPHTRMASMDHALD
jgi:hypothetical protein